MSIVRDKLVPEDAAEALAWWDAGESVFTIEMGGLGPGYEQAIHVGIFEVIRKLLGQDIPEDQNELNLLFRTTLSQVNEEQSLGLSGAQGGAITSLAYNFLTRPWQDVLDEVEQDRRIQVSNKWPGGSA